MGDFAQLLKRCDIAVEQLERGDHELAWSYVNALLLDLRLMYDLPNAYYPRVFLGATLLAKANDGRGGFEEAEQWFARLIAEGHPLLDANAHAGRGNALLAMGSYEEAIGCFWAAANCLSAPDPALLYNIVRAHVMADIEIDEAQLRARSVTIEDGLATRQPGDLSRMAAVQMLSHAYRGDWAQAQHAWREVADAEDVFPELIVDTCHCFIRHARGHPESRHLKTALAILKAFRQGTASSSDAAFCMLEHTEARLHRDMGDARHAGLLIARLVSSYPTSPVLAVDAAMFALECGDLLSVQRFASHAAHLRKAEASRPPVSAEQFEFAVGQAFWLLGREPEARECFRRSGLPASKWFAQSMPGLRAAAVQETPTWPRLFGPGDR